jgi:hypothetical protein
MQNTENYITRVSHFVIKLRKNEMEAASVVLKRYQLEYRPIILSPCSQTSEWYLTLAHDCSLLRICRVVGGLEYLRCSPESRRRRRKWNPVPGGKMGSPYHWRTEIQGPGPPGWGWTQGCWPCSVRNLLLRIPKEWKPDGLIHDGIDKSGRIF